MKCTIKEQESCNVEKMTCKGCAYNEKSADEMFEELGYEKDISNEEDSCIYVSVENGPYIEFDNYIKAYKSNGYISIGELQAINKKVKELRLV